MKKYLIGIDGGGTKTFGVLWNEKNEEVKTVTGGFTNFNINYDEASSNLHAVIGSLITSEHDKVDIIIGLSGKSGIVDVFEFTKELEDKYNAQVLIVDDAILGLHSLIKGSNEPAAIIISGTGSILYGINDNVIHKVGGYGHILGDEGSSWHLVIQVFKYLIDMAESGKTNNFTEAMYEILNIKNTVELKQIVYKNKKTYVASFAEKIDRLAELGHKEAKNFLKQEAVYIYDQLLSLMNMMKVNEVVKVGIIGSFLTKSRTVKTEFEKLVNSSVYNFEINYNIDPTLGALYLQKEIKK